MDEYRYEAPIPRIVSVGVCWFVLTLFFTSCVAMELLDMSNWSMNTGSIGSLLITFIILAGSVRVLFASVKYTYKSMLAQANKKK